MQPAPRASSSVRDAALSGHHALLRGVLHADSVMARRLRFQSVLFSSPIGHLLPCPSSISQSRRNLCARAEPLHRQSHSTAALFHRFYSNDPPNTGRGSFLAVTWGLGIADALPHVSAVHAPSTPPAVQDPCQPWECGMPDGMPDGKRDGLATHQLPSQHLQG